MTSKFVLVIVVLLLDLVHPSAMVNGDNNDTQFDIADISFNGATSKDITCSNNLHTNVGLVPLMPISYGVNYSSSGRCLYSQPVRLRNPDASVRSFSTTFSFSYDYQEQDSSTQLGNIPVQAAGFAFIIVADPDPSSNQATNGNASSLQYLGVLNAITNNRNSSHTFAVEFDIYTPGETPEFNDPPYDHVGIDLNSMNSSVLHQAGYNPVCGSFITNNFTGELFQSWIDYEAAEKRITVSLGFSGLKPPVPLISLSGIDLSYIIQDKMWIGFSCAGVGSEDFLASVVYGWSFNTSGPAKLTYFTDLSTWFNSSYLDDLYTDASCSKKPWKLVLAIIVPVCSIFVFSVASFIVWHQRRERKLLEKEYEMIKEEELEYGPAKFSYNTLRSATKNFGEKLGVGGFGSVYKGQVFGSKYAVAVKRLSPDSRQGELEFFSAIRIIGQLRHGNLVQLQGWCHEKDELLLVYEFMPNGTLEQSLYNGALPWERRFAILKGVGKALLYLHEEWDPDQCVVHRDVKPSNVMLDEDFNARLGDFGMAIRSHKHEEAAASTVTSTIANGTEGYMAPEAVTQGEVSPKMDIYSFGVVALEIASGRATRDSRLPAEQRNLLSWVLKMQPESRMEEAMDERLRGRCDEEEVRRVLEVGIWCCRHSPEDRPSMSQALVALGDTAP